jgi:hypothetical protein
VNRTENQHRLTEELCNELKHERELADKALQTFATDLATYIELIEEGKSSNVLERVATMMDDREAERTKQRVEAHDLIKRVKSITQKNNRGAPMARWLEEHESTGIQVHGLDAAWGSNKYTYRQTMEGFLEACQQEPHAHSLWDPTSHQLVRPPLV